MQNDVSLTNAIQRMTLLIRNATNHVNRLKAQMTSHELQARERVAEAIRTVELFEHSIAASRAAIDAVLRASRTRDPRDITDALFLIQMVESDFESTAETANRGQPAEV